MEKKNLLERKEETEMCYGKGKMGDVARLGIDREHGWQTKWGLDSVSC